MSLPQNMIPKDSETESNRQADNASEMTSKLCSWPRTVHLPSSNQNNRAASKRTLGTEHQKLNTATINLIQENVQTTQK